MQIITLYDEDGESMGNYSGETEQEAVEKAWLAVKTDEGPLSEKPLDLDDFEGACIDSGAGIGVEIEVLP